jgi:hypothetical protein
MACGLHTIANAQTIVRLGLVIRHMRSGGHVGLRAAAMMISRDSRVPLLRV